VRILPGVTETRQPTLPVRRQELQRIPAFVAPGIGNLAAFENDVVNGLLVQEVARRQAGMAGTNDDNVSGTGEPDAIGNSRDHLLTSTFTFVGFVMMSNTAERFCD